MYILALDDANVLLQLNRNKELSVIDDIFCNVRKGYRSEEHTSELQSH